MLDESEWARVATALAEFTAGNARQLEMESANFEAVSAQADPESVLRLYFDITGFRETNIDALRHHRISLYGEPCPACGKPLRTHAARFCAECGTAVGKFELAIQPQLQSGVAG